MNQQQPTPPAELIITTEPEFPGHVVWECGGTLGIAKDEATAQADAAALAQSEPEVVWPSDEELYAFWNDCDLGCDEQKGMVVMPHIADFARAVLARWGRPAPAPAGAVCKEEIDCETCGGSGTIDETLGGYGDSNPAATCPDCDGIGVIAVPAPTPAGEVGELVVSVPMPLCERNWDSILSPSGGYEMADDAALRDGAQLVNGEWWAPVFGCDSLESALARIRERLQRQAAPAPAEGEVAELVAALRAELQGFHPRHRVFGEMTVARLSRTADLLEQRHPAPAPVSERLPGPEDCDAEGRCWWWDGEWGLVEQRFTDHHATHWLPAHALPLPAGEGEA